MIITSSTLRELRPKASRYDKTCDVKPGFVVRVYPTGKLSFRHRYRHRGQLKEIHLGEDFELAKEQYFEAVEARQRLEPIAAPDAVDSGEPLLMAEGSYRELVEGFMREHVLTNLSRKTERNYQQLLDYVEAECGRQLDDPRCTVYRARLALRDAVRKKAKTAPVQANRIITCLSSLFKWGMKVDRVKHSPVFAMEKQKEKPKSRLLDVPALKLLLPYLEKSEMDVAKKDVIKLLLLTCCRSGEILELGPERGENKQAWGATFRENLEQGRLVIPKTKNGYPHLIALPQIAVSILRRAQVRSQGDSKLFNSNSWGLNQALQRACESVRIEPVSPHDLRRTSATMCGQAGIDIDTIGRLLNHSSSGVTRKHYALYDKESEKRAALELLAQKYQELGMEI